MAWSIFVTSIGLLFVFEGILPFLSPPFWRNMMLQMIGQHDRILRAVGLISMLVGLGIVSVARDLF